jgi:hypothetical protein
MERQEFAFTLVLDILPSIVDEEGLYWERRDEGE